jgi:hypothetical protein
VFKTRKTDGREEQEKEMEGVRRGRLVQKAV